MNNEERYLLLDVPSLDDEDVRLVLNAVLKKLNLIAVAKVKNVHRKVEVIEPPSAEDEKLK